MTRGKRLSVAAKRAVDAVYPPLAPSTSHWRTREKQRIAYMLGYERGYRDAARARFLDEEYTANDSDAKTKEQT